MCGLFFCFVLLVYVFVVGLMWLAGFTGFGVYVGALFLWWVLLSGNLWGGCVSVWGLVVTFTVSVLLWYLLVACWLVSL